jgi:two-component system, chemotaxis family, sensor kinase CheA
VTDIRQRLLAAFALEHREHLHAMRDLLSRGGRPDIDELHRRAHSLKGAARAVGLPAVVQIAHRLEDMLAEVQQGRQALGDAEVKLVRQGLSEIEDLAGALFAERPLAEPGERSADPEEPGLVQPLSGAPLPSAYAGYVRVPGDLLEKLLESAGGLLPEIEHQAAMGGQLRRIRRELGALAETWRTWSRRNTEETCRAVEGQFNRLSAQLEQVRRDHERAAPRLRQAAIGLREDIRGLRIVPADDVLPGLGPMVRDMARQAGKEIDVDVAGLETEADRLVLQALKDPLMHLLRNAVSHGIETPEERTAAGKPRRGQVSVKFRGDGNRLAVTVADDGRGVDPQAVIQAAIRRGLLRQEDAAGTSPETIRELIFESGFSTRTDADEVAGRGMGLSVVHRVMTRVQGEIRFLPSGLDGVGAGFLLSVPQSLSTQALVLLKVAGETLALPTGRGMRCHALDAAAIHVIEGRPTIELAGEDTPVIALAPLLGLRSGWPSGPTPKLVVLAERGRRLGLAVDDVLAVRPCVVFRGDTLKLDPRRYVGTILLDDGTPCLVLQPTWLLEARPENLQAPQTTAVQAQASRRPRVLIVDDSITTRTLERSILEAHGYDVRIAVDGAAGLEVLGSEALDLVVSDIEMPRMDGFVLLKEVRANPATAALPFILVTSRDSGEDRERGLRLGADAYIVKSRFDQDDLLEAIRRLT